MSNLQLLPKLLLIASLVFESHASFAQQACVRLVGDSLVNHCSYPVTIVYCGISPTGNASLDCTRNKRGMAGMNGGGRLTVADAYGGYSSVATFECPGGKTPSNVHWTGSSINGSCPR